LPWQTPPVQQAGEQQGWLASHEPPGDTHEPQTFSVVLQVVMLHWQSTLQLDPMPPCSWQAVPSHQAVGEQRGAPHVGSPLQEP